VKQLRSRSFAPSRFLYAVVAIAVFLALPRFAGAQDQDQDQQDPPSRVARLNFIQGAVSFQPAGTSDWVEANPNRPLTTGDQLWADDNSRGELHLGGAILRIASQTGISFLNLDDQTVQIQVAQGTASLRVLHMEEDSNYEIDTPNLAFTILRPGEYRVDVNADGSASYLSVLNGNGEVTAGGQAYDVRDGVQYIFAGGDEISYDEAPVPVPDDFDTWYIDRDRREDSFGSARYVSRDVIGYEDLDANGTWRDDPMYGHVWIPNGVAAGWAPYSLGHWAYVAPWGWTWVDDEPWGFAPFHYGRWAYVGGYWGWVPGPVAVVGAVYVRPVYAPALVAFVGGGGFAAGIAFGGGAVGVAWFPLGPRDVWIPSYHISAAYMERVNVTNSVVINRTQITNVYNTTVINRTNVNVTRIAYMNQNAPGAVTAVPKTAFQNGEPVAKAAVRMNAAQIEHPQVVQAAAMTPSPKAVVGPNLPARSSARPPVALANRAVVTKTAPSPRAVPVGRTQPLSVSKGNVRPAVQPGKTVTHAAQPNRPPAARPNNAPVAGRPATQPAARPEAPRPQPTEPARQPEATRPNTPPARPEAAQPSRPPAEENRPERPQPTQPARQPEAARPNTPPARPEAAQPSRPPAEEAKPARPEAQPARPPAAEPKPATRPPAEPEAKKPAPAPKESKPAKDKDKDKDKDKPKNQ
jgi:hypothetical protein